MSNTTSEKITMVLELSRTLATIAVPVVIAYIGNAYNVSIKDSENRIRYVELAIAQLKASPTPETASLREWAVELLDSQAPVKLSQSAKTQLASRPLQLSVAAPGATLTGLGSGSGGGASATTE